METKQASRPIVHKVAVIGGGLGGLATAIALRKQGIDAHVYERAKEFRPVGAGLALFSNGLNSLDAISPGIVENLKRASCQLNQSVFKKHTGETITQNTTTQRGEIRAANVGFLVVALAASLRRHSPRKRSTWIIAASALNKMRTG